MVLQSNFFLFLLGVQLMSAYRTDFDPYTVTSSGKIVGTSSFSRRGRLFSVFRGIPYAKPPVGSLRFKEPEEIEKWNHTFFATKDAPKCAQKNYLFGIHNIEGSEDCLYLNVYTPNLDFKKKPIPVMVFIHWGGFFAGYSGSEYLGPEYFMDKDVVLVTFNYRLGVLGFFSTYDDSAPGNFGFKDQTLALKWVQKNIKNFGGDNTKVTIFGQSAGGASVHYHMISKNSEGLFQRAISESGTALALWAQPFDGKTVQLPQIQAKLVGCGHSVNNSSSMVDCLRQVDVESLIQSGDRFKFFSVDPLTVYLPAIEKKTANNPNPFITKHPIEYIKFGNFSRVPWIVGIVSDEGLLRASALWSQSYVWKNLNKKFDILMPKMMMLSNSAPNHKIPPLWEKIKSFYFKESDDENPAKYKTMRGLIDLYTDRAFHYSTYQSTLLHSVQGHNPIWFYKFNYRGQYTYKTLFSGVNETTSSYPHSASHCDDLLYLFKSKALFADLNKENDQEMIDHMINLWTDFATYGNPTPRDSLKWKPITNLKEIGKQEITKSINFLHIKGSFNNESPSFQMDTGIYNNRLHFWEELPLIENIKELDQNHQDF
ncbi:hypothetical protein WA026_020229 [Henosepilachna vigintioctopunctata]|uniref:Carboxylic ester hydrolase n=1 Tax=Henosepilachna vigintioctopunctata TaxID=420089 RepID=A0AAW1TMX9_9CUCU